MYNEDTPRSDVGFATPRDDRFYTPRMHNNNNSSGEEWQTPRDRADAGLKDTQRSDDYGTPRDEGGYVVSDPHRYWNEQYKKTTESKYAESKSQNYESVEDDMNGALGLLDGISEKDVEDIFSYARHGRCADIERLLDKGIPLNVRDEYGNTILTIACQNGNKKVAKLVLRRGADINARNHKGNTPLHYCFHYGYGDTLGQYLMEKGANSSIRNNAGRPCWDGV
jgi:hypothetical protein